MEHLTFSLKLSALKNKLKHAFICFDNEPQAQKKGEELGEVLALQGVNVEIFTHPDYHDPGDMPQKVADEIKQELLQD